MPHNPEHETKRQQYMSAVEVQRRYGISDMALYRWLADDALKFPKPAMRVRDRRYWLESDLITWERAQGSKHTSKAPR